MNATVRPRTPGLPEPQVQTFHAEPTVLLDRRSRPWLVLAAEQDPLRTRNGRLPIPRHCRERLKEIAESGVLFDAVVLAHELDPEQVDITAIPRPAADAARNWLARCSGASPPIPTWPGWPGSSSGSPVPRRSWPLPSNASTRWCSA